MQVLLDQYGASVRHVKIWNHRKVSALKLAEEASGWLKPHQSIEVFDQVNDCVKDADLIVTATFACKPVVMKDNAIRKTHCHIMAVGAPRQDWCEMDPVVWNESLVFVDSFAGAKAEAGDLINAKCPVEGELGAFISEKNRIESAAAGHHQRTAFKSLGLAIEDLVAGKMAFENQANKTNSRWPVDFIDKEKVMVMMNKYSTRAVTPPREKVEKVENQVTHLDCKAILINSEVMVCELISKKSKLALLYKAKTGQLKAIVDIEPLINLDDVGKCAIYEQLAILSAGLLGEALWVHLYI